MRLFLKPPPSISSALFYGYIKLLTSKAIHRKKISRNKDLRSHLAIELGTSCTESHAPSKCAELLALFLSPFLIGWNASKNSYSTCLKNFIYSQAVECLQKIHAREVPCIVFFLKGKVIEKTRYHMPAITYILFSKQKLNFHTICYPGRTNTL